MKDEALRSHVIKLLDSHDAHVDYDQAIDGIPPEFRGRTPKGAPHSPWQIVEHIRATQHDILDFCMNPAYAELKWPDDYWPPSAVPASAGAWNESVDTYRRDREAFKDLMRDPRTNLFGTIPHGSGQTYLREALLVADHTAYHVGQLVIVRRMLGIWPG
jgi:DinB superfamily